MDLTFVIVIATLFAIVLSAGAFMFFKIQQQAKKNFDLLYRVIFPMVTTNISLLYTQTYSLNILLENAEPGLISKDKFEHVKALKAAQKACLSDLDLEYNALISVEETIKEMGL